MAATVTPALAGAATPQPAKPRPSLVRNVLFNWAGFASAVVYSLVITPIVIPALGREGYGIWSFLNGFVAYTSLFYLGLGTALVKYLAQHYAVGERQAVNRLVSVVLTIYGALGVAALCVGVLIAPFMPELLHLGLSVRSAVVAATVIVLAFRIALTFVGSGFSGVLIAQGRTDLYMAVAASGHVLRLAVIPFALRYGDPLLSLAIVVGVTAAVEVITMVMVARRQDRDLRVSVVMPSSAELKLLYGFGLLSFVIQLAETLVSYSDTTIIGLMLGASAVALYVLPLQLTEYGRYVVIGVVSVMLPHLTALHATGRSESIRSSYHRVVRLTGLVAVFVNVNVVALGPDFLRLWVGSAFAETAFPILIALGIAGIAHGIGVQSQTPFCLALGRVRFAALVLAAEGLTNLVLSVTLAPRLGITGVAVATAIPAVAIGGCVIPIYVSRLVGTTVNDLLSRAVSPVMIFLVALTATHALLWVALPGGTFVALAGKFCVGAATAGAIGWSVSSDSERRLVRATLESRRRALRSRQIGEPASRGVLK